MPFKLCRGLETTRGGLAGVSGLYHTFAFSGKIKESELMIRNLRFLFGKCRQ